VPDDLLSLLYLARLFGKVKPNNSVMEIYLPKKNILSIG